MTCRLAHAESTGHSGIRDAGNDSNDSAFYSSFTGGGFCFDAPELLMLTPGASYSHTPTPRRSWRPPALLSPPAVRNLCLGSSWLGTQTFHSPNQNQIHRRLHCPGTRTSSVAAGPPS